MPTPHYGQPRYRAIADEIKRRIENGVISPGALLPAESALTTEFRTSRGTVRHAIATLREEGAVVTEHGRGTYAAMTNSKDLGTTNARGRIISADAAISNLLGVDLGTPIVEHESVIERDEKPWAIVRVYKVEATD
ncbi:GntR family transcriptional regulator [Micromonospora parva]|uniref:GntR family transcriptional regulator n=1 Tax=Micromonospora parva TaxID=1464048 RepID=UPI00366B189A